jgi:hypothetical protein
MKTKSLLFTVAIVAAGIISSVAQSNPSSPNAVDTEMQLAWPDGGVYANSINQTYNGIYLAVGDGPMTNRGSLTWTETGGGNGRAEMYEPLYSQWNNLYTWPGGRWPEFGIGTVTSLLDGSTNVAYAPTIGYDYCYFGSLSFQSSDGDTTIQNQEQPEFVMLTGGAPGTTGNELYAISGGAFTMFYTDKSLPDPLSTPVPPNQIQIGSLGNLDANGVLYVSLPVHQEVTVTPHVNSSGYQIGHFQTTSYKLVSQTLCPAPGNANNARTTIGIGEVVSCSMSPAITVNWSLNGGGSINSTNGSATLFTASHSPSTSTIHAKIGSADLSLTFHVIAPSSVTVLSSVDWPPRTGNTNGTLMGAETDYLDAIGPTNVSFDNVLFRENPEPSSIAVTWPNGTNTTIHFNRTTSGWNIACGQFTVGDQITSPAVPSPLIPTSYLFNGTANVDFSFGNSWTYQYMNEAGAWVDFYTLTYEVEYHGSNKQCHVIYLGKPGGWQGPY